MMPHVTQIWRYPIKSHSREELSSIAVAAGATLPWDRAWAVAHEASDADGTTWAPCQNFSRGSKAPLLMAISSRFDEATGIMTLKHPDLQDLSFNPDLEHQKFLDWAGPLVPSERAQSARLVRSKQNGLTDTDYPSISIGNLASHRAVCQKFGRDLSLARWRGNIWVDGLAPWEEFEWRFVNNFIVPHVVPKSKKWVGEKLNTNETLTIVSEQGLGDTIQFMRFLPYLSKMGYSIDFIADKRLHSIIKASGINENPIPPPEFNKLKQNKWLPLMSLGKILEINPLLKSFESTYIKTNYESDLKWKKILSNENKPIIGINWQGNNKIEIGTFKGRSFPLELFSSILKGNDIKLISLQKGFGTEQLENCSFKEKFIDCQDEIDNVWDFLELSSIMKNCSLIITSDTCVAHLSGGLGIKTWLLLKKVPDWRWGLEEQQDWYPSVKLLRQNKIDCWEEPIRQIEEILKSKVI